MLGFNIVKQMSMQVSEWSIISEQKRPLISFDIVLFTVTSTRATFKHLFLRTCKVYTMILQNLTKEYKRQTGENSIVILEKSNDIAASNRIMMKQEKMLTYENITV